jgi:hypothetical protein
VLRIAEGFRLVEPQEGAELHRLIVGPPADDEDDRATPRDEHGRPVRRSRRDRPSGVRPAD